MKSIQIFDVNYEMIVEVSKKSKREPEAVIEEAIQVAFNRKK